MLAYAKHLPCSCGGVIKKLTWPQHLAFNIFFLLIAMTGIILQRKHTRKNIVVQQFREDAP
jgi:hypothetical protein